MTGRTGLKALSILCLEILWRVFLALLWLVARIFQDSLGSVLILIKPSDERDVRPIKSLVASRRSLQFIRNSTFLQLTHDSVTRWWDLAKFPEEKQNKNTLSQRISGDIILYLDFLQSALQKHL